MERSEDPITRTNLDNLRSQDRESQNQAFFAVLEATDKPVDWAIVGLRNLYDVVKDEIIRERALELIETEEDLKYRKKYATVWRVR